MGEKTPPGEPAAPNLSLGAPASHVPSSSPPPPFPLPLPLGKADGPVSKKVPFNSAVPGIVVWGSKGRGWERSLNDLKFKKKMVKEKSYITCSSPSG